MISLRAKLFIMNMVCGVNMQPFCTQLLSHSRSFNNMLLDFSKQCTDAMLEGLSNITTQTCCPLCGHKKLNKLDDSKKFNFKKENRD